MTFSEKLNQYLELCGVSYTKLARTSQLSVSTVARYKSGEREPEYDSEQLQKLACGLAALARDKELTLTEEEILSELRATLKNALRVDYETYVANLNALLKALDIRVSALARALSFDSSHISKVLSRQRRPGSIADFNSKIGSFISRSCTSEWDIRTIAQLIGRDEGLLGTPPAVRDAIVDWLGTNTAFGESDPIGHFLEKMEAFSLDDFIQSIHFDDIKLPSVPFQLPTVKSYSRLEGMKKCELDFLKATVLSKSRKDCILYSDMPLEEMARDGDFAKKWMFGMSMLLKKGLHLNVIHDIHRPFNEMMLGLEGNIPMYMTGQISPYYLPKATNSVFTHIIKVSGAAAVEGSAIAGYQAEGKYYLSKSEEDIRFTRKKAERLLEKARPLMEIYRSDRRQEYFSAMQRSWQSGSRLTVSASLPLFTIPEDLLRHILTRNGVGSADTRSILRFRGQYAEIVSDYLRDNTLTIVVPEPSRERFEVAPLHLALSEMFYESDVAYSFEEYTAHLQATAEFSRKHANMQFRTDASPVFRNISYSVIGNEQVIVSKNKFPTIHFVIHHSKMVKAFRNFILISDKK